MVDQVKAQCQAVAVRFVADTRTDEFLNIGVVLFCAARGYAGAKFLTSWARISSAFPTADLTHLRRLRRLFEKACDQWVAGARQPPLFREVESLDALLTSVLALDDATITFSKPISGLTANPEATLAELFRLYVGKDKDEGICRWARRRGRVGRTRQTDHARHNPSSKTSQSAIVALRAGIRPFVEERYMERSAATFVRHARSAEHPR